MSQPKLNIFILSYHFPPHPIVGSRRWAKFAKHLNRMSHLVSVFSSTPMPGDTSNWDSDILGLEVKYIPSPYPSILDKPTHSNIWQRLHYKFAYHDVMLRTRGNPYDRSIFWKSALFQAVLKRAKNVGVPDVIMANGPPFSLLSYACELKDIWPNTKVFCDFRDPWTWWYNMGYATLNTHRRAYEEENEKNVMSHADVILIPSENMKRFLVQKYPHHASKIVQIDHGFDDDYIQISSMSFNDFPIRILSYGTTYPEITHEIKNIVDCFEKQSIQAIINVYTPFDQWKRWPKQSSVSSVNISLHQPVNERDVLAQLSKHHWCLLFTFVGGENNISTKYMEVVASRTPILLIGVPGKASQFVLENRLGLFIDPSDFNKGFKRFKDYSYTREYNKEFDVSSYSYVSLTKKLIYYLK